MESVPNFHFFMRDMSHEVDEGRLTEIEAAVEVCEYIQKALRCATVSAWVVSGATGNRIMRRAAGFDGVRGVGVTAPVDFPERDGAYFNALVRHGCYISADTFSDPQLDAVKDTMLIPFNIRSLLSAAYGSNGEVWGIITCTDNVIRHWRPAEVTALRRCAAEISVRSARRRARQT